MIGPILALSIAQTQPAPAVDPHRLAIGDGTPITVALGITDTKSGKGVTAAEVAAACDGEPYLMLGESHDSTGQKRLFAEIVNELVKRGRNVAVGLEMFTRPNQPNLAPWSMGYWTEEEFIEKGNWKTEWGFDFSIYRPLFNAVKEHKLPMVALNVPRDWVRAVGRGGPSALPEAAKGQVPAIDLSNKDHAALFTAMIGGHPMGTQAQMDNMRSGQVLWDTGMADTAIKWTEKNSGRIMVMVAGSGHAMYHQGINFQIMRRTGKRVPTLIAIDGDAPKTVSRGIGDWVWVGAKN